MRNLRSLCFALFAAACASLSVPATAATIYTLTGNTAGTRLQLNPNNPQQVFGSGQVNLGFKFDFTGNGPVTSVPGLALVTPLSSGTFLPTGGLVADIVLPTSLYFAVGTGVNTGLAAFGVYDSFTQDFDSFLLFSDAGLAGYDALSSLPPVSVSMIDSSPFRTSRLGNLVEWDFASTAFSNVQFSAVSDVPEPATLTLFGAGILGAAAMRRRKQRG